MKLSYFHLGSSLSNVVISKTQLTLELINSSIRINKSNISTAKLVQISGLNYNMLDIYNSQIVCSDTCVREEASLDMILKITNSSIIPTYDAIYLNNIGKLQFSLIGSTLDPKYHSNILTFGSQIQDGQVEISNCTSKGIVKMLSERVVRDSFLIMLAQRFAFLRDAVMTSVVKCRVHKPACTVGAPMKDCQSD